jgi:hypothetical protein
VTNLGDLKLNELVPADALSIVRQFSEGTAGDQVLNSTSFVDVGGVGLTPSTTGTFFVVAVCEFWYDDRDAHNKKNVHFEGQLGTGFFPLGAPATAYAPLGHETLHSVATTWIGGLSPSNTVWLQARALDDTGAALPDSAIIAKENSGILMFQL